MTHKNGPPTLYTTREVATLLRCSIRKIQYLIANGTLAAVIVGRHYRVPQAALDALLAEAVEEDPPCDMHYTARERPEWYYSPLSPTTLADIAQKAPHRLHCTCGGVVTAAKMSSSGADDGPAYLYCEACYRAALRADRDRHVPVAENAISITISDIIWPSF